MRSEDVPQIRGLPLFRSMAEATFADLMRGAYLQTLPPQIELVTEGERSDFLHILVEGSVELFSRWNRRETTMMVLAPVSTFIVAATITDRPYLMSGRTLEKSRVALIPAVDVRRVFFEDRAFADAILGDLSDGFRRSVKQTKDLKLRTSLERLANFLLRRDAETGGTGSFELPHEKRLIASLLGMTPESLSRAFSGLRPYGVRIEGAAVVIEDRADLETLARPDPLIDDPTS